MSTGHKNNPASPARVAILVSSIVSLVLIILILAGFALLPSSTKTAYATYTGVTESSNNTELNDPFTSYILSELIKTGSLVSLKDTWSFQTSFYQTIITLLIAVNGIIAAISVIYIKSSSEEKAEETANKYMNSHYFGLILKEKISNESEKNLRQAQKDFNSSANKLDNSLDRLALLERENQTLRQQIKIIAERIAKFDNSESEEKDNKLTLRR